MKIPRIGIALAKQIFQLHGVDVNERAVLRRQQAFGASIRRPRIPPAGCIRATRRHRSAASNASSGVPLFFFTLAPLLCTVPMTARPLLVIPLSPPCSGMANHVDPAQQCLYRAFASI